MGMTRKNPHTPCPKCDGPKSAVAELCQPCRSRQRRAESRRICSCGARKHYISETCLACYQFGLARGAKYEDDGRPFPLSGEETAHYGAIVCFRNTAGQALSLHRRGPVKAAVAEACDAAIAADPTFRVTAVSTPTSIFADLQGARLSRGNARLQYGGRPQFPERVLVPAAMLHESLL